MPSYFACIGSGALADFCLLLASLRASLRINVKTTVSRPSTFAYQWWTLQVCLCCAMWKRYLVLYNVRTNFYNLLDCMAVLMIDALRLVTNQLMFLKQELSLLSIYLIITLYCLLIVVLFKGHVCQLARSRNTESMLQHILWQVLVHTLELVGTVSRCSRRVACERKC